MTIHIAANGTIELSGTCTAEEADALLQQLLANPGASVDWSACEAAHAAIVQVLLVAGACPTGTPINTFLGEKVAPLLGKRAGEIVSRA